MAELEGEGRESATLIADNYCHYQQYFNEYQPCREYNISFAPKPVFPRDLARLEPRNPKP